LEDGDRATAWSGEPGAWVTARASGAPPSVTGISFELPGKAPRAVALLLEGEVHRVALPALSGGTARVYVPLPRPVRTGCVSIVIAEGDGGIAEIAIHTGLSGPGGLRALAD